MLAFAAEHTNGTHTYFVPPEHTAKTRAAIGVKPWICAAQAVILDTDAAKARRTTEAMMKMVKLDIAELTRAHDGA